MRIAATKPLFAWDALEDSPGLRTVREFLEGLPDAKLLAALDRWRDRGRDDYPVRVLGTPVTSCECRIPSTTPTTGHSSLVTRHSQLALLSARPAPSRGHKEYPHEAGKVTKARGENVGWVLRTHAELARGC